MLGSCAYFQVTQMSAAVGLAIDLLTRELEAGTYRFSLYYRDIYGEPETFIDRVERSLRSRETEIERNGEGENGVHDLLTGRLFVCPF
jgi:hypothetical protein